MESNKDYLIKLADFMVELVNSYEPIIWESGYYLADNIILKISIYVAEEKNISIPSRTNFPTMYNIIANNTNNVLSYNNDNDIRTFHQDRSMFAHDACSIRVEIRRERALAYAEKVKEIMVAVGLISNKSEIYGTNYLRAETEYLKGNSIDQDDWDELVALCRQHDFLWRNVIAQKEWEKEDNSSESGRILFFVRNITKYCTKFEHYRYYSIRNVNTLFRGIIKNLEYLVFYLKELLECDGNRIKELYNRRRSSSDHLWIFEGLNIIWDLIMGQKNEFKCDKMISAFQIIGSGINSFLKRYIGYIHQTTFEEDITNGQWVLELNDDTYKNVKEKKY